MGNCSQFVDEARVQASLVHSNIVPVFDFGTVDGEYFMIEEYIIGRDLARVSARWDFAAWSLRTAGRIGRRRLQ